nr:hypothetical protein [Planctomycetota bacterium]
MSPSFAITEAAPRRIVAIAARCLWQDLSPTIISLSERVAAATGEQGARTGPYVVVYRDADAASTLIEVGMALESPFEPTSEVMALVLPGGPVATAVHV